MSYYGRLFVKVINKSSLVSVTVIPTRPCFHFAPIHQLVLVLGALNIPESYCTAKTFKDKIQLKEVKQTALSTRSWYNVNEEMSEQVQTL